MPVLRGKKTPHMQNDHLFAILFKCGLVQSSMATENEKNKCTVE